MIAKNFPQSSFEERTPIFIQKAYYRDFFSIKYFIIYHFALIYITVGNAKNL